MKPEPSVSRSGRKDDLDWARYANATDEVLAGLNHRAKRRVVRRWVIGGALAVAFSFGAAWQLRPRTKASPEQPVPAFNTLAVIRPATQVLPDGSVVELKEGAEITVSYTEKFRRVELVQGAAHFAVVKNPARPFLVAARRIEVRAVGTAFAVDSSAQTIEVVVTEGKVAVEAPHPSGAQPQNAPVVLAALAAGHRTVVHPDTVAAEIEKLDESAMNTSLSWRIPRIEFSKAPLAQVVAEMNKHNRTQVVLADDSIRHFRISGALRADRLDALTELLAEDFGVLAETTGDQLVLRRRR